MLLLFRASPFDLVTHDVRMGSLPWMPVQTETLHLWLWDPWHHAHFDNHFAGIGCSFRLHRTDGNMVSYPNNVREYYTGFDLWTYFPSLLQKDLYTAFPLPVA